MITEVDGTKLDFHQLLEHSTAATFIIRDAEIVYINKAALHLLKAEKREEVLNNSYHEFILSDYHDLCEERLNVLKEGGKLSSPIQVEVMDAKVNIIPVEISSGAFCHNGITMIQAVAQDITDKIELQRVTMESEKMAVMGELAASIVHEVRNPLTIIKGFLDLIRHEVSGKHLIYTETMAKEVERVEKIANNLLFFAKRHDQNFAHLNVVEVAKDMITLVEAKTEKKHIGISLEHDTEFIDVYGDEVQLKQALLNIVVNAIDATDNHGKIAVAVHKTSSNEATLTISDTGQGMSQEQLDRMWESFYTTKEKGTGLGLKVTRNIVQNHNGTIHVDSVEGKGTTFTIKIPVVAEQ
ncbi:Protein-glutamate O-methyltransferase [Lentibacillus sp. JNUCC-1]|uniref:two-component system sensor histidine kinase NtrB n=1 Tax=Lentibacillus sp. JNUCC-1 TaxID=2654513 RepID=UPI0012E74B06|nr:ATP-binding protein [Lentibacillus sp. JNUCC-1]MUV37795.1 Protein-glutamate O-methyltransferase [Lentibacillus sp. JNUCC-1]